MKESQSSSSPLFSLFKLFPNHFFFFGYVFSFLPLLYHDAFLSRDTEQGIKNALIKERLWTVSQQEQKNQIHHIKANII